jgi:hypothetical protein
MLMIVLMKHLMVARFQVAAVLLSERRLLYAFYGFIGRILML